MVCPRTAQVHLQTRLSIQRMFLVSLSCDPTSYLLLSLCTKHNYLLRLVELETKSSLLGDDKVLLNTRKKMKDGALVDIFDEK